MNVFRSPLRTVATVAGLAFLAAAGCLSPDPYAGSDFEKLRAQPSLPFVVEVSELEIILVEQPEGVGETEADGGQLAGGEDPGPLSGEEEGPLVEGDDDEETVGADAVAEGADEELPEGFWPPLIARAEMRPEVRERIEEALSTFEVFALTSGDVSSAGLTPDLRLKLQITASNVADNEFELTNWVYANCFLWLLAGLPGWIIEDVRYLQPVDINFTLTRPDTGETIFTESVDVSDENTLSFIERASVWQYLLQIVVPPFLTDYIAADMDDVDEALYRKYLARMQSDMARSIKSELLAGQIAKRRPILLMPDAAAEQPSRAWIFSDQPLVRTNVERIVQRNETFQAVQKGQPGVTQVVEPPDWRRLFQESLGESNSQFLQGYVYWYSLDLDAFPAGEGSLLRFTAEFQTPENPVRTWTARL